MLKTITKQIIDVDDFDNLVKKTYNKIYSFQQQDDCKSRQMVSISVPIKKPEDFGTTEIPFEVNGEKKGVNFEIWLKTNPDDTQKYFKEKYENELFWKRNFYPSIEIILNDLHSKGLIESGSYLINIDW